MLGLLRVERGSVRVFDLDPVADPVGVLSRIGYLSEENDLPGWMRVDELIRYSRWPIGPNSLSWMSRRRASTPSFDATLSAPSCAPSHMKGVRCLFRRTCWTKWWRSPTMSR